MKEQILIVFIINSLEIYRDLDKERGTARERKRELEGVEREREIKRRREREKWRRVGILEKREE